MSKVKISKKSDVVWLANLKKNYKKMSANEKLAYLTSKCTGKKDKDLTLVQRKIIYGAE